jgi:Metal-dependent hydrolases of the beta-lactamase superfamily I
MIRIIPIASGSTGNCMYIEIDGKALIIDLGVTAKNLVSALSRNSIELESISSVLITHSHSDHVKGLEPCMNRLKAEIYMSPATKETICCSMAKELQYNSRTEITEGLWVTSFRTWHDCPGSVGYIIETADSKIGYATDLGKVTDEILSTLMGSDCVVIEANHDVDMLKQGPYPVFLKRRILSDNGHLSNECCAETVSKLAENGTRHFLLAHLSRENNTPETALSTVLKSTADNGVTIDVLAPWSSDAITFE